MAMEVQQGANLQAWWKAFLPENHEMRPKVTATLPGHKPLAGPIGDHVQPTTHKAP
jgi:hypothetical protein